MKLEIANEEKPHNTPNPPNPSRVSVSMKSLSIQPHKYFCFISKFKMFWIKLCIILAYFCIIIGIEFTYRNILFNKSLSTITNLQHKLPSSAKMFFKTLSHLGTAKCTLTTFAVVFIFFPISSSYLYISVIIYASYTTNTMKLIYQNPRPIFIDINNTLENGLSCNNGFGNPSGHSLTAVAVYLSLWHIVTNFNYFTHNKKGIVLRIVLLIVFICVIVLIVLSRIILGAHSINQVIYGSTIGLGIYGIFFYIFQYHLYDSEFVYRDFAVHFVKKVTIIAYSCVHCCMLLLCLLLYFLHKPNESKLEQYTNVLINKQCEKRDMYLQFQHDALFQCLSVFGIIGANCGIYLLFYLVKKKYNSDIGGLVVHWNWRNRSVKHFFIRLAFAVVSAVGIVLYFAVPGNSDLWIVMVFKSSIAFFSGLFGLYGVGIYLSIISKAGNLFIYTKVNANDNSVSRCCFFGQR